MPTLQLRTDQTKCKNTQQATHPPRAYVPSPTHSASSHVHGATARVLRPRRCRHAEHRERLLRQQASGGQRHCFLSLLLHDSQPRQCVSDLGVAAANAAETTGDPRCDASKACRDVSVGSGPMSSRWVTSGVVWTATTASGTLAIASFVTPDRDATTASWTGSMTSPRHDVHVTAKTTCDGYR